MPATRKSHSRDVSESGLNNVAIGHLKFCGSMDRVWHVKLRSIKT